jgi:hypothetical protein
MIKIPPMTMVISGRMEYQGNENPRIVRSQIEPATSIREPTAQPDQ